MEKCIQVVKIQPKSKYCFIIRDESMTTEEMKKAINDFADKVISWWDGEEKFMAIGSNAEQEIRLERVKKRKKNLPVAT
jgi:hypothetical protein